MKKKWIVLIMFLFTIMACGSGGETTEVKPMENVVVALGDSITAGIPLENINETYTFKLQTLLGIPVIAEGNSGGRTFDGSAIIDTVLTIYNPKYLIIYLGTNDVGSFSTENSIYYLKQIIKKAKENNTIPIIATLGPFLENWEWKAPFAIELNIAIRELATEENIRCTDLEVKMNWNPNLMFPNDGQHPSKEGHTVIAEAFYQTIKEY